MAEVCNDASALSRAAFFLVVRTELCHEDAGCFGLHFREEILEVPSFLLLAVTGNLTEV